MLRTSVSTVSALLGLFLLSACASMATDPDKESSGPTDWEIAAVQHGEASWYGIRSNGGTQTASGEKLRDQALTAAHKTLPMGTRVRVTNLNNGKSEVVRITDRGPYTKGRIIDVTVGVAKRLEFHSRGIVDVKVEVLADPDEGETRDA